MSECDELMGGMFGCSGLSVIEQAEPQFLEGPCLKLSNAHSGIFILCQLLRPKRIWLPAYLCHSIVEAVQAANLSIEFYPVSLDLKLENLEWLSQLENRDLVLFIDYFDFESDREVIRAAKEKPAWVVQDAAQALLSSFERAEADFVLYSPRQYFGVPDGGILQSKCDEDFSSIHLKDAPDDFVLAANHAFNSRTEFDRSSDGDWFSIYNSAEKLSPIGCFAMTALSAAMLRHSFDYEKISENRRSNYQRLYNSVPEMALYGALNDETVPLGFPIVSDFRDHIRTSLYSKKMYCPLHWSIERVVPECFEDAHRLSGKLLTILCDQRYSLSNMKSIISVIRKAL
jgi:hypothetical protein